MKPFYLKDIRSYQDGYKAELLSMIETTIERRVHFADGSRGFIIGDFVYAPFHQEKSCVAKKDNKDLVLTFDKIHKFGVAIFKLPFGIPCEPLHFRHAKIHKDTFLFRVFDDVTLCRGFSMLSTKGMFEVRQPDHFCPVFDRFGHLIGINAGIFCGERICMHIQELL